MMDDVVQALSVPIALIDDFIGEGGARSNPAADTEALDALVLGYGDNNLQRHETKAKKRVGRGTYWGCRTHGVLGRSLAPQEKTLAQILLTLNLIVLGFAPLLLAQHTVGGWIFILQFRRVLFALLHAVFKCMALVQENGMVRFTVSALQELFVTGALSPIAQTDNAVPTSPWIYAGDASNWCAGAARARISTFLSRELYRFRERRGGFTKLASQVQSYLIGTGIINTDDIDIDIDVSDAKQFWCERVWVGDLVLAHKWRTLFSVLFNRRDHINRQETRAYRMEAPLLATGCEDTRVPSLYDSRVLLGGITRGRSKAASLNPIQRKTIPSIVGGGVYTGAQHVRTHLNTADGGPRRKAIEQKQETAHPWVIYVSLGHFTLFDAERAADELKGATGAWSRRLLRLLLTVSLINDKNDVVDIRDYFEIDD